MRDRGRYHTTHGLWALILIHENGCLLKTEFSKIAGPLVEELYNEQPEELTKLSTIEIDLYAERLLMLIMASSIQPSFIKEGELERYINTLLKLQNFDGSWGENTDNSYRRYHATMISSWALPHFESQFHNKIPG